MTAPDSRDSVERVVDDIHRRLDESDAPVGRARIRSWADRLQALARGPQQAGGEDGEVLPKAWWVDRLKQQEALTDAAIVRAETAEAALREAGRDAERLDWLDQQRQHYHGLRMVSWGVAADSAIGIRAAIDAAIEQAAG